ncbi:MAG: peptidoglycan DD-metalloendopeptidase family protein [Deltaproteobacteria bacterium]|jgi:septal ring factor EnvC (AmiA/AmiB activator)|nr:peptidoglycan DD-metalloendopeptidase family protein [Deltaproteobacteria bacterium]
MAEKKRGCSPVFTRLVFLLSAGWLVFSLPFSGFSLCCARAAADPAEKKQQIEKIEKDLDREREQLLRFDEKEEKLLEELSHLEKEIEEKRKNLKELEEKVSVIKKDLRENQAKMSQLEKSLKALEDRLGKRLDAFYRYAKRGYIRLLATADGLDTLRKRFKYLRALLAVDLTLLQETADLQKQYREEIASVKEKLLDLEGLEKEESVRVAAVKEDIDRKVVLLMKTHKEKEFLETGVKELELASQKLKETLIQIEKRDEKRTEIPSDFANARGKLPMPIDGRILREGASSQGGLKGITIEGRPGAEVKAVYAGRIDFSGTLKGYGELVVINHGSRYFTVSAHLAQREKQEGEMVKSGEVIGSLGKTATPREARLYFEIRKGGGTLDPIRWLKVH